MRGNTSRELRLAFDGSVAQYVAGRPPYGPGLVNELMTWADLHTGDLVLEVGAGTGQLTTGLLDAGLRVVALEPGPNMAGYLRARLGGRPGFSVKLGFFEDFDGPEGTFAAVVSANAFHWVDPAVSYIKAAQQLCSGGCLGLIWTFPILARAGLQRQLNSEAFAGDLADLRREPNGYVEALRQLLAAGRAELAESRAFCQPHWELQTNLQMWTVDTYVAFLCSLANGTTLADLINARVRDVLLGQGEVEVANHVYLAVARRADTPGGSEATRAGAQ
jgi:SAM-dependent methyltransferase